MLQEGKEIRRRLLDGTSYCPCLSFVDILLLCTVTAFDFHLYFDINLSLVSRSEG